MLNEIIIVNWPLSRFFCGIFFEVRPLWSWLYGSWIYNYLCNQCLSPLILWVRIPLRQGVLDTTLYDKVCQWLAAGRWFSAGTSVFSTNKIWILLNVALSTVTLTLFFEHPRYPILQTTLIAYTCHFYIGHNKMIHYWSQHKLFNETFSGIYMEQQILRNIHVKKFSEYTCNKIFSGIYM